MPLAWQVAFNRLLGHKLLLWAIRHCMFTWWATKLTLRDLYSAPPWQYLPPQLQELHLVLVELCSTSYGPLRLGHLAAVSVLSLTGKLEFGTSDISARCCVQPDDCLPPNLTVLHVVAGRSVQPLLQLKQLSQLRFVGDPPPAEQLRSCCCMQQLSSLKPTLCGMDLSYRDFNSADIAASWSAWPLLPITHLCLPTGEEAWSSRVSQCTVSLAGTADVP